MHHIIPKGEQEVKRAMKSRKRMLVLASLSLFLLIPTLMVSVVLAQEPDTAPLQDFFSSIGLVIPIAVVVGMVNSILGYLRSTPPEEFELDKFLATIIISLLIGIVSIGLGWTYEQAEQWLANGAVTLYVYWIAKIIAIKVGWMKLEEVVAKPG